jgi:non-ribosomal peptide synthase protein (TIGR01720 family)
VPVGVPGELHIGGAAVARGYLNRPGLTAERFIPDPFIPSPASGGGREGAEARLYKTGDLARYLPDGNVEFLGRVDYQVKVRGFRVEPGEVEAVLRQHPGLQEVVVVAREDEAVGKRLVGYAMPAQAAAPTVADLRAYLAEKVPEYMVPSTLMVLEDLPMTPSGKIDRRALPAPDESRPDLEVTYVAPRTPEEETLAGIWSGLLGVKQVGVHDNFFELGGDSILSIQLVARVNQAGLRISPRQIFERPTVAGLAAIASAEPAIQAEQGPVEGPVPFTPIQRWFFEQNLPEPHHWNQAVLFEVREPLERDLLEAAVQHLETHHDALRLRFTHTQAGWQQNNAGVGGDAPFEWIDLSAATEENLKEAVETRAAELQAGLNLAQGPLWRVAYFDRGDDLAGRLLMIVHHLAVDGVSWRILLEDLQSVYEQLARGQTIQLPPKTTSFRRWARRLEEYARSDAVRQELDYWLAGSRRRAVHLPVDYPGGRNTEASMQSVSVSLTEEETQALLQEVPAAYRTEMNDVLLTALAQVLARWIGEPSVLMELEGHGREDLFDDVDISRTVGWFTTVYPVWLDLPDADGPGRALKAVKEQLRGVPNRGMGYGLLRYLHGEETVVAGLGALPKPQVSFNYLGQFDQILADASPFRQAPESRGPDRSPKGERTHLLDISGGIGGGRLGMEWVYSENLHRRETIERLAQDYVASLRAIIAHCRSPEAGGVTPSDFDLAGLDQKKLDKILNKIGKVKG